MAYRVVVLPSAEADLENLDPEVRRRVLRRIVWLGENARKSIGDFEVRDQAVLCDS